VKEGVRALYAYIAKMKELKDKTKTKDTLFDDDTDIYLMVALKKSPEIHKQPFRIPIKHSLYAIDGAEICLLTKDPQSTYKEMLAKSPVKGITKVIGMQQLRHNYIKYQDKRILLKSYQLFLADERIIPLLRPLLGKKFFESKRQPIPVNLTAKDLAKELTKARDCTFLYLHGPCCSIRMARSSFTKEQIVENIMSAIDPILNRLPKKIKGVQGIYIKTADSIAIPLYNSLPETLRIDSTIPSIPIQSVEVKTKQEKKSTTNKNKGKKSEKGSPQLELPKKQHKKKKRKRPIMDAHLRKKKKIDKLAKKQQARAVAATGGQKAKKE